MSIEALVQKIRKKVKTQWWVCIVTVFLLGMFAHGYRLTNSMTNWDGLINEYSSQNMAHVGRIFLTVACGISSYYELPWLNGLLSLIFISFISLLVTEIFVMKNHLSRILISGLLVTFPVITSTLTYIYTADGYLLGALLVTAAVWLVQRNKNGWIPAGLLIFAGFGIYQAYAAWAAMLFLLAGIWKLFLKNIPVKDTLIFLGKGLLSGIMGAVLYYLAVQAVISFGGVSLDGYQGVAEIYAFSEINLDYSLKQCALRFLEFFFGKGDKVNLYVILNILVFLLILLWTFKKIIVKKVYKDHPRMALCIILGALFPVACFALYLIGPYVDYHMLMCLGTSGVYLYLILLMENTEFAEERKKIRTEWGAAFLLALIIYNFIVIANISYHKLEMSYDRAMNIITRMADRLEQADGWEECENLAVLGRLEETKEYSVDFPPEITGITEHLVIRENFNVQAMLQNYADLHKKDASEEEKLRILDSGEYEKMKSWPEKESVKILGKTAVIKLGDYEP